MVRVGSSFLPHRSVAGDRHRHRIGACGLVAAVLVVLLLASFPSGYRAAGPPRTVATPASPAVVSGPLTPVPLGANATVVPGSQVVDPTPSVPLHVVLSLALSNQSALRALLSELSNPKSPEYHHYLTADQFDGEFSPSAATWAAVRDYLAGFPVENLTVTPDRVALAFDASPSTVDAIFHTSEEELVAGERTYVAPASPPELPLSLARTVAQIDGLNTYSQYLLHPLSAVGRVPVHRPVPAPATSAPSSTGYLPPATVNGVQYEYAPDFQVAYDEQSLFQEYTYPTNATVATILWSGSYSGAAVSTPCGALTNGETVGPWVPSDIYQFFNETLPAGEPHPTVTAVPISGAPSPSCLASWDSTGANVENTLDLEMVGSTAPGAQILNVYGPSPTTASVDQAFATILSPPTTLPPAVRSGLANVTVISNSWGAPDQNDTAWMVDLEQAQARGISVLASSGDSGDNAQSSKYTGTTVEFPASMAYDTFGVTAAGGTTVLLNPTTLHLASQVAWNISAADTSDGGPAGSTGGISSVFPEPSWQQSSSANAVLNGAGRGVPDVAAIANNTLMTLTVNGHQYLATNASSGRPFVAVWGTSVASPLLAGIVAEIDHVLRSADNPVLGFLDPEVYSVANDQFAPLPTAYPGIGTTATGNYTYSLSTTPFEDVVTGRNALYAARPGYDLVTGWGSIDAYNYTMYVLTVSSAGVSGHLSGIQDRLDLAGLSVTSPGVSYNASTQQNFFLANSLGAPIYWVQNVVYIQGSPGQWSMTFTGWVIFPFWASYPSESVYEWNVPSSSLTEATPLDFNFTTQLENPGSLSADVAFSFGVAGTSSLRLPVPGASYLIGSLNYSYDWQGTTYTNGGSRYAPGSGFLSPQFGLVGGPSAGTGDFVAPTAGSLSAWVEPWGTSSFVSAQTETFTGATTQTGEGAQNLAYTRTGTNTWSFAVQAGSSTQGVLAYEGGAPAPTYGVQFNQSGAPATSRWYVNITGAHGLSALGSSASVATNLANGTYSWTAAIGLANWTVVPSSGQLKVSGQDVYVSLVFSPPPKYTVQFNQTGVPPTSRWYVNVTGGPALSGLGSSAFLSTTLVNGSYAWTAAIGNQSWTVQPSSGRLTVAGGPVFVDLTFSSQPTYLVQFNQTGAPNSAQWFVNVTNGPSLHSSGAVPDVATYLAAGTYAWAASIGVANWTVAPDHGTLVVSGGSVWVDLVISSPPTFAVQFSETGVPSTTSWYVNVSSGARLSATGATPQLSVPLVNGSYSYTASIGAANWSVTPSAGSVAVQGTGRSVSIVFALLVATVSFQESGLPNGTTWWVNATGAPASSGNGTTINVTIPYGSVAYRVGSTDARFAPTAYSGQVDVPSAGSVNVTFAEVTYLVSVVVSYTGGGSLPNWTIQIGSRSVSGTGSTLSEELPNGTYTLVATVAHGYSITPAKEPLTVYGGPLVLHVTIRPSGSSGGTPPLVGGLSMWTVIGAIVALAVLVGLTLMLARRSRRTRSNRPPPST